jgi:uncharacterized protein
MLVDIRDILKARGLSKTVEFRAMPEECGVGDADCAFGEPMDVTAELTSINNGVIRAKGRLRVVYGTFCARCLKPLSCAIEKSFDEQFAEAGALGGEGGGEGEVYALGGKEVDMAPLLRDAIMLELPIRHLCQEGCRSLCPVCGKDLNEGGCDCGEEARTGKLDALKDYFKG